MNDAEFERVAVLERLNRLRDSKRAGRVYQYVDSVHDAPVSVTDLLHVLRADDGLALELRSNTGRTVICAVGIEDGRVAYPVWHHSAVAAKAGHGDVQVRSVDQRHEVADALENRRPLVRVRSETPLADLSDYGIDRRVVADGGIDPSASDSDRLFRKVPQAVQAPTRWKSLSPHEHSAIPIGLNSPSRQRFAAYIRRQERQRTTHRDAVSVSPIPRGIRGGSHDGPAQTIWSGSSVGDNWSIDTDTDGEGGDW